MGYMGNITALEVVKSQHWDGAGSVEQCGMLRFEFTHVVSGMGPQQWLFNREQDGDYKYIYIYDFGTIYFQTKPHDRKTRFFIWFGN